MQPFTAVKHGCLEMQAGQVRSGIGPNFKTLINELDFLVLQGFIVWVKLKQEKGQVSTLVKPEITARLILQQRNFIATHVAAVVAVTIVREMVDMSLASIVTVTH